MPVITAIAATESIIIIPHAMPPKVAIAIIARYDNDFWPFLEIVAFHDVQVNLSPNLKPVLCIKTAPVIQPISALNANPIDTAM